MYLTIFPKHATYSFPCHQPHVPVFVAWITSIPQTLIFSNLKERRLIIIMDLLLYTHSS